MPSYPHIERYYEDKQRLIDHSGSDNEQNIRPAFQNYADSMPVDDHFVKSPFSEN